MFRIHTIHDSMKEKLITFVFLLVASCCLGQAPFTINYQAVVRTADRSTLSSQVINVQFSVHSFSANGPLEYQEEHLGLSTNEFGLFSARIGSGTSTNSGNNSTLNKLDWAKSNFYLSVEVDVDDGNGYQKIGEDQFVSVPYALHAAVADSLSGKINLSEIVSINLTNDNVLSLVKSDSTTLQVDLSNISTGSNISFSENGDSLLISGGKGVQLSPIIPLAGNVLQWDGTEWTADEIPAPSKIVSQDGFTTIQALNDNSFQINADSKNVVNYSLFKGLRFGSGITSTGSDYSFTDLNGDFNTSLKIAGKESELSLTNSLPSFNPTASNQIVGTINFRGQAGFSQYHSLGAIRGVTDTTVSQEGAKGHLEFLTTGSNFLQTEKMRVGSDGRVGIGVQKPTAILDVNRDGGTIRIPRKSAAGDPAGLDGMIYYNQAFKSFRMHENGQWKNWRGTGYKGWSLSGDSLLGNSQPFIGSLDSANLEFRTNNQTAMIITPSGNIGINNVMPNEKLAIGGNFAQAHQTNGNSGLLTSQNLITIFNSGASSKGFVARKNLLTFTGNAGHSGSALTNTELAGSLDHIDISTTGPISEASGGIQGLSTSLSANTISIAMGSLNFVRHKSNGSIAIAIATNSQLANFGNGNIQKGIGQLISVTDSESGTIQNSYGLYVEDIEDGLGENYSIFTKAGDILLNAYNHSSSRFIVRGSIDDNLICTNPIINTVGIGTKSAKEKLHVNGRLCLEPTSHPSITTNRLYNSGNKLYWNGIRLDTAKGLNGSLVKDADGDTYIDADNSDDDKIHFFDKSVSGTKEFFTMNDGRLSVQNTGGSIFLGELAGVADNLQNNRNIFVGRSAGTNNVDGQTNIGIGELSLAACVSGSNNIALGNSALRSNLGNDNISIGVRTLQANNSGTGNIAVGVETLRSNVNGSENTSIGNRTMLLTTTGSNNSTLGSRAMRALSVGNNNSAIGMSALESLGTGNQNSAVGSYALRSLNGNANTSIGFSAGEALLSGSNNTFIGANSNVISAVPYNNVTVIGANASVAQSNSVILGNNANVGIGTPAPQSKLDVRGKAVLDSLNINNQYDFPSIAGNYGQVMVLDSLNQLRWKNLTASSGSSSGWNMNNDLLFVKGQNTFVGIGTETPTHELEVEGNVHLVGDENRLSRHSSQADLLPLIYAVSDENGNKNASSSTGDCNISKVSEGTYVIEYNGSRTFSPINPAMVQVTPNGSGKIMASYELTAPNEITIYTYKMPLGNAEDCSFSVLVYKP